MPERPELLLEGTIQVIGACVLYASADELPFDAFLKMQHYDPNEAVDTRYVYTFDIFGKAFGRVLYSKKIGVLDLADLYGHPWHDYGVCGYQAIHISRIDGRKLGKREMDRLKKDVTKDLRYDYDDDELDIWFDRTSTEGSLFVTVQDHCAS